jgi:hypothetical protein
VFRITWQILFLASPLFLVAIAHGLCIKYDLFPGLKRPLDFGRAFKGKRIFGDHKAWRGLTINVLFCVVGVSIQAWLQRSSLIPAWLPLLDYPEKGWLLGLLIGVGMTAGELPNSFLKRRMGISPGRRGQNLWAVIFFVFDQIDLAFGIWVFVFWLIKPPLILILWSIGLAFVLHLVVSTVGYVLGMRKTLF